MKQPRLIGAEGKYISHDHPDTLINSTMLASSAIHKPVLFSSMFSMRILEETLSADERVALSSVDDGRGAKDQVLLSWVYSWTQYYSQAEKLIKNIHAVFST